MSLLTLPPEVELLHWEKFKGYVRINGLFSSKEGWMGLLMIERLWMHQLVWAIHSSKFSTFVPVVSVTAFGDQSK